MSAVPLPITSPLVAAGIAGLLAGAFACADVALVSTSDARLGAVTSGEVGRFQRALERALRHRNTIQSRYVAGRVIASTVAVGSFALWLSSLESSRTVTIALAAGALLLLALWIELASAFGVRSADVVLKWAVLVLRPLEIAVAPLAFLTSGFTALVKRRVAPDPKVGELEMELAIDLGERTGQIRQAPAELIRNVLEFSELTARDAMIPRTRVNAIPIDTPLEEVVEVVTRMGNSRYPVYRNDIDDVFGVLHAKDIFRVLVGTSLPSEPPPSGRRPSTTDTPTTRLLDIIREPVKFVSESQPLSTLLADMRQERQHLAVVVDEYGGTSGIVTLEDVLEEIVGDIRDEYDADEIPLIELGPGRVLADASMLVCDLSEHLGHEIDPEYENDTLAGMLNDLLGKVPEVGTSIAAGDLRFIVRESDEKHIEKVEVVQIGHADSTGPRSAVS